MRHIITINEYPLVDAHRYLECVKLDFEHAVVTSKMLAVPVVVVDAEKLKHLDDHQGNRWFTNYTSCVKTTRALDVTCKLTTGSVERCRYELREPHAECITKLSTGVGHNMYGVVVPPECVAPDPAQLPDVHDNDVLYYRMFVNLTTDSVRIVHAEYHAQPCTQRTAHMYQLTTALDTPVTVLPIVEKLPPPTARPPQPPRPAQPESQPGPGATRGGWFRPKSPADTTSSDDGQKQK